MSEIDRNSTVPFKTTTPDIGSYFKDGWALYRKSFGFFLMASVVFWLLSLVSLSILMGPLIAGFLFLFVQKLRDEPVSLGDMFSGFRRFFPIVLAFYFSKILIAIGFLLLVIPGLILIAHLFFIELLILDKNLGLFEAMKVNRKMASRRGLWNYVGLNMALLALLNIPGVLSVGVGYFLILPFVMSVYAVAYEDAFGNVQ